jgi:xanthine dehydrogenase accessory factor
MLDMELLEKARGLAERGEPYALATVVRAVSPTSAYVGAQAIVLGDGTMHGWIGGGCAQGVAIDAALRVMASGEPKLVRISNDRLVPDEEIEQHAMACASNGTIEIFIQPGGNVRALCVLGSTPAAEEARFLATRLGIGLADAPDQARVVLVATQGHGDEDGLERALRSSAAHVLMIASARKATALRESMRSRGIDETQVARLSAPAGPDSGARTPAEIALTAMVGVLAALRGRPSARTPARGVDDAGAAPNERPTVPAAPVRAKPLPGRFVNPVCGVSVSMANPMHVEVYEGESYYFCCDGCWKKFLQEPARFAAIHHSAAGNGRP